MKKIQNGVKRMGMAHCPQVDILENGAKYWEQAFDTFQVKVYVPKAQPLADIVNFGFRAPYLLVMEENNLSRDEAVAFARERGFEAIAARYSSSVVFVYPTAENGWEGAPDSLYADLIAQSRIAQYYKDGMVLSRNRFTGEWGECFIRGAIFRAYLYGHGKSADFIARNYMKAVLGQFLWGPGEITPAGLVLEKLSIVPAPERADMPVVSIGNSKEANAALQAACNEVLVAKQADAQRDFAFISRYKRWCGQLEMEPDMAVEGMVEETGVITVPTSPDNLGDDQGTKEHQIGYLAYYQKGLPERGKVPLMLAFHGGGDSCYYITHVSGWWRVAKRNGFLLVAVENHLNSTATEMMAFIEELKKKYPIDEKRIYASGFSMGGCKSWDIFQEYPEVFAGLAPMSATYEVGRNVYGKPAPKHINKTIPVPIFYAGGEITPLPELPFQAEKCRERMEYVFRVNKVKTPYNVRIEDKENWENKIFGINGDKTVVYHDDSRNADLTVHYFESEDGVWRTAFGAISGQGHECREHTCETAWQFLKQFSR